MVCDDRCCRCSAFSVRLAFWALLAFKVILDSEDFAFGMMENCLSNRTLHTIIYFADEKNGKNEHAKYKKLSWTSGINITIKKSKCTLTTL